jgi:hypothetical protein
VDASVDTITLTEDGTVTTTGSGDIVVVGPNGDALVRLTSPLLAKQHDEWLTAERRYLPQASMDRLLGAGPSPTLGDLLKEGAAV